MANETGEKKKKSGQSAPKLKKISSGTYSEKIKIPREMRRAKKKIEKFEAKGWDTKGLQNYISLLAEQKENARNKNGLKLK